MYAVTFLHQWYWMYFTNNLSLSCSQLFLFFFYFNLRLQFPKFPRMTWQCSMNGCELVAISCVLFGYTGNSDSHNNSIVKDRHRERNCRGNLCVFDQNCKITNCCQGSSWYICLLCDWFFHNCWMLTELLFSMWGTMFSAVELHCSCG